MTTQPSPTTSHHDTPKRRGRPQNRCIMAVLVVLALAAAVVATTAATSDVSSVTAQETTETREATEEQVPVSVRSYASEFSVSLEEANRRLDRIQPIQQILASIRDIEGTRVAGWGIDHTGTFKGWVQLTGTEPANPEAVRVADAHSDVEIRLGAAHSYSELRTAQDNLFDDIGPTGNVGSDALVDIERMVTYTGINMEVNAIRIGIDPGLLTTKIPGDLDDPGPVTVTDEAFQTKATQVTQQLQDIINVAYVIEDGRGFTNHASFSGGEQIGGCTAGFAARQFGTGVYGIITAGHCGDEGSGETQTFSMNGITLPYVNGWASVTADAQFHRIPTGVSHTLRDDYLCNPISYPPVTRSCDVTGTIARSNMIPSGRMIGDYVCHTGRSSGFSCGTIRDINARPTNENGNACVTTSGVGTRCNPVFVRVEGTLLRSCGGDSGGPWYSRGVSYGIHKGSYGGTSCTSAIEFAVFSAIHEVGRFLGVQVMTSGPVSIN